MAKYIIQIPANYRARVGGNSQVTIDASSPREARKQVIKTGIPAAILGKAVEIKGEVTYGSLPTDVSQYVSEWDVGAGSRGKEHAREMREGKSGFPLMRHDRVIGANNPNVGRDESGNFIFYPGGEEVSGTTFAPNVNPQPTMAQIQAATPFTHGTPGDPFSQPQGYQRMTADDFTKIRNFANQPSFDEAAFFGGMTGGSGSDVTTTAFDPRMGGAYNPDLPSAPTAPQFPPGWTPESDPDAVNRGITYGDQGYEGEDVSQYEIDPFATASAASMETVPDKGEIANITGTIRPWAERVADIRFVNDPSLGTGRRLVVPADMWAFDKDNPIGMSQMELALRHFAESEGSGTYNGIVNQFTEQARVHFDDPDINTDGVLILPKIPRYTSGDMFKNKQEEILENVIKVREGKVETYQGDVGGGADDGTGGIGDGVGGGVNGGVGDGVGDGVGGGVGDGVGGFGPELGGTYNPEDVVEEIVPEIEEILPPPPQPFDMGAYTPFEDPTAIQEMLNTFNRDPERYYTTETVLGPDGELITQQVLSPVAQAALQAFSTQRGAEAMEQAARFGTSTPFGAIAGLGGTSADAVGLAEQQAYSGITSPFAALQAGAGISDLSQILRGGVSAYEQRQLAGLQARGGLTASEQRQLAGLQARGGLTAQQQSDLTGLQARGGLNVEDQYALAGLQGRGGLSVEDQYALAGLQGRGGLSVQQQLALAGVQGRGGLTPQERLAEQRMSLMPSLFQISPESLGGLSQVLGEQDLKNYLTPFFAQGGAAPSGTTPVSQGTHVPISSPTFAPPATGATTPAARGTVGGYMKATPFQKGGFQAKAAMAGQELPQFLGEVTPFGVSSGKGTLAASTF